MARQKGGKMAANIEEVLFLQPESNETNNKYTVYTATETKRRFGTNID